MKYIILLVCLATISTHIFSQSIQGEIIDYSTKGNIPNAQIAAVDYNVQTLSNDSGKFTLKGSFTFPLIIQIKAFGFEMLIDTIESNQSKTFELHHQHIAIDEIEVIVYQNALKRSQINYFELKTVDKLNLIPQTNLGQMIENIPGVYNLSTGPGVSKPVIRGMQGSRVITLLNGVRMEGQQWGGDHGMGISDLGIGTVEILKGPASLRYGASAIGGILFLNNQPFVSQGAHQIQLISQFETNTLGTSNSILYNGSNSKLNMLVGSRFVSHADYQTPSQLFVKNSRFQELDAKFSIAWHKGVWVSNLKYDLSKSIIGIPGHSHDSVYTQMDFLSNQQLRKKTLPYQYLDNHVASWENKLIFKKHSFQLVTSFTMNQLVEHEEKYFTPAMQINTYNLPYRLHVNSKISKSVQFDYGLQGMYLQQLNAPNAKERLAPDASKLDNGLYFISTWTKNYWKLQGGLRGDLRILNSSVDSKFTQTFSNTFSGLNFHIGGTLSIKSKSKLRLNMSTGYRIPELSELLSNGVHHGTMRYEIGNRNLTTEKAIQLDLAYKYTGDHLSIVVNPFLTQIRDYIFILPTDSIISGLQVYNYAQSNSQIMQLGSDIGIHYHPHFAHILHIESAFSYLYVISQNKNQYSLIPQPKWSNSVILKFNMNSKFKLDNAVLKYNYFLAQNQVATFEKSTSDFGILDAGLQFSITSKKTPVVFQMGIKNITNNSYINHLSRLKRVGIVSPGRSYYIKLVFNLNFK